MLAAERGAARNTLAAYRADLEAFAAHAAGRGERPGGASAATLQNYMQSLHGAAAARTAARRLSCLRGFHRFLLQAGVRTDDPTMLLLIVGIALIGAFPPQPRTEQVQHVLPNDRFQPR